MAKAKAKSVEKATPKYEKRVYKNWVPPVTALKNQLAQRDEEIANMKQQLAGSANDIAELKGQVAMARTRIELLEKEVRDEATEKDAYFSLLLKLYTL